jgi:hypothetical protein
MKSHFIIIFLFVFIGYQARSQEVNLFLKGIVLDSKTKIPLSYASISIAGKSIGTLSNSEGKFEFSVPGSFHSDSLKISYIGYKTFSKSVSEINDLQVINLEELPLMLNAVTIRDTQLTAKEVLEKSRSAIPVVYPSEPYLMEAFFRSWEKIDFTDSITYPGMLLEVAATIFDPGYSSAKGRQKAEDIYIREIRRSKLMPGWNHSLNVISFLLKENDVRYSDLLSFRVLKGFLDFPNQSVYSFEEPTEIDEEDLYVIRVEVPNSLGMSAFYKVYVSMDDYAVLQFELNGNKQEIDFSKEWHTDKVIHRFIFKRYQNRPYLSYASIHYIIKKLNILAKNVIRTEEYYRSMLINEVVTVDVEKRRKLIGPELSSKSLKRHAKDYNESFWKNYNMVLENPLDQQIAFWFEQQEKLEGQYRNTNGK